MDERKVSSHETIIGRYNNKLDLNDNFKSSNQIHRFSANSHMLKKEKVLQMVNF